MVIKYLQLLTVTMTSSNCNSDASGDVIHPQLRPLGLGPRLFQLGVVPVGWDVAAVNPRCTPALIAASMSFSILSSFSLFFTASIK